MSDIFISYEKTDLAKAKMLARALIEQGWSVFWDRNIPIGGEWQAKIEKEIRDARAVVVLWSATSVKSRWVRDEANDALQRDVLVPLLIQNIELPMGFRSIQTGNLSAWRGERSDGAFKRLIAALMPMIKPAKKNDREEPEPLIREEPEPLVRKKPKTPVRERSVTSSKPHRTEAGANKRNARTGPIIDRVYLSFHPSDRIVVRRFALGLEEELPGTNVIWDIDHELIFGPNLEHSNFVLALISPTWLKGQPIKRKDSVYLEISTALKRGIPVFPILIHSATMPSRSSLPTEMRELAKIQAEAIDVYSFTSASESAKRFAKILNDRMKMVDRPKK